MPKAATPTFEVDQIIKFKGYDPAPADGAIFKPGQLLKITKINADDQGMEAFPVFVAGGSTSTVTSFGKTESPVASVSISLPSPTGNASMP